MILMMISIEPGGIFVFFAGNGDFIGLSPRIRSRRFYLRKTTDGLEYSDWHGGSSVGAHSHAKRNGIKRHHH